MTAEEPLVILRAATADDVGAALYGAYIDPPLVGHAEMLELFNRMLQGMTGESAAAKENDTGR